MAHATLHEFMAQHRAELLDLCVQKVKRATPDWDEQELADRFSVLIDEVFRAQQQADGLPVTSPLPGRSEAAARYGGRRQMRGYAITNIATDVGSISDSVGQLGAAKGMSFSAREYQVFNQSIDTAVASALDQFWKQSRQQQEQLETERMGFLAHELRNALSTARMSFSILKRGQLGVNSRTGEVLGRSLSRLDELIRQALLSVRLHAGAAPQFEKMSVASLLREIADAAVPEREIRIEIHAEPPSSVEADPRMLTSALSNLLQNALKFTHAGGTIVLRGYPEDQSVVLEVEDECGGLPPGKQEELFDPFVQKGSKHRGLGLGLAITREAVEARGGHLSVRNLPGKGCIFSVKMPASR